MAAAQEALDRSGASGGRRAHGHMPGLRDHYSHPRRAPPSTGAPCRAPHRAIHVLIGILSW